MSKSTFVGTVIQEALQVGEHEQQAVHLLAISSELKNLLDSGVLDRVVAEHKG